MKKYLIVLMVFTLFSLKSFSLESSHEIVGPMTFHLNDDDNYYVTPADGVSYNWTVVGGTILDGQGTSSIDVQWDIATGQGEVECNVNSGADIVIVWPGAG